MQEHQPLPVGLQVPYGGIASRLREGVVIPFLGAAASFAGAVPVDSALPGGAAFSKRLAKDTSYPGSDTYSLTKVAQFAEDVSMDRDFLLAQIAAIFLKNVDKSYRCGLTDFLEAIPREFIPKLMVTTNYDVIVEQTFERLGVPYIALAHCMHRSPNAGRLICYSSLGDKPKFLTKSQVDAFLKELADTDAEAGREPRRLYYKMHGTSLFAAPRDGVDSIVLTENDYLDFLAQGVLNEIPKRISTMLREGRLLFLGYSLQDWNFRVLLWRLQDIQKRAGGSPRHWACLKDCDEVEERFWYRRAVTLYRVDLQEFFTTMAAALR